MKSVAITVVVLVALLLFVKHRIDTHDGEVRVTKIELIADHDPQIDPQACWITATGRRGHSRVEYRAVNFSGSCPEIESIVVHRGGFLVRGDLAISSGDSSPWSASVLSERVIQ
jgi:hypothetical protein